MIRNPKGESEPVPGYPRPPKAKCLVNVASHGRATLSWGDFLGTLDIKNQLDPLVDSLDDRLSKPFRHFGSCSMVLVWGLHPEAARFWVNGRNCGR